MLFSFRQLELMNLLQADTFKRNLFCWSVMRHFVLNKVYLEKVLNWGLLDPLNKQIDTLFSKISKYTYNNKSEQ